MRAHEGAQNKQTLHTFPYAQEPTIAILYAPRRWLLWQRGYRKLRVFHGSDCRLDSRPGNSLLISTAAVNVVGQCYWYLIRLATAGITRFAHFALSNNSNNINKKDHGYRTTFLQLRFILRYKFKNRSAFLIKYSGSWPY